LIGGSILAASAPSAPTLLVARGIQAIGAASEIVGPAVISDVFPRADRGVALGLFFSACQLGPALAPVIGGALTHWHSWRITQMVIAIASSAVFVLMVFALPETTREGSRGIDARNKKFVVLNPLKCFSVLRSPSLLAVVSLVDLQYGVCLLT
jgi:MFS family permease